jgi:hypothetical protein
MIRLMLCGAAAGAIATLAMDLVLYRRYRRGDGDADFLKWETAEGLDSWDNASAPARVGKLFYEVATGQELLPSEARLATNVMHWGYGIQWGVLFAVAIGCPRRMRRLQGALFGLLVWLASYVSLPIAGFYEPIWSYGAKTLWDDLYPHLVYGATTASVFRRFCR